MSLPSVPPLPPLRQQKIGGPRWGLGRMGLGRLRRPLGPGPWARGACGAMCKRAPVGFTGTTGPFGRRFGEWAPRARRLRRRQGQRALWGNMIVNLGYIWLPRAHFQGQVQN